MWISCIRMREVFQVPLHAWRKFEKLCGSVWRLVQRGSARGARQIHWGKGEESFRGKSTSRGSHNNRTFHFSHLWSESRASTKEERGKVENTQTSRLLQLTQVPAFWYPLPNFDQFHSDLDFLCIKYSLEIDTWHWPGRTTKQWKETSSTLK